MKTVNSDLCGRKFSRLMVIEKCGKSSSGHNKYLCKCDCGNEVIVIGTNLTRGLTKSCKCYSVEIHVKHGKSKTPEYLSWQHMKDRCLNKESDSYSRYGGRGIKICDRWISDNGFENFLEDMGPRPKGTTLDRWPNNKTGHYEPSNCRWGTDEQQSRNKRSTHWIEYNGERKILLDWAIYFGVKPCSIQGHLKRGKTGREVIDFYINKRSDASNRN